MASVELADLTWQQAETVLTPDALIMIPLGAAAKEHGPHLRLDNDRVLAECLKDRVSRLASFVVAPTLSYHHYPAFSDYPGSTSLGFDTARDLHVDVVRSLADHGPRRFYVCQPVRLMCIGADDEAESFPVWAVNASPVTAPDVSGVDRHQAVRRNSI